VGVVSVICIGYYGGSELFLFPLPFVHRGLLLLQVVAVANAGCGVVLVVVLA
jgi:hypothetical protein